MEREVNQKFAGMFINLRLHPGKLSILPSYRLLARMLGKQKHRSPIRADGRYSRFNLVAR